ncbi:MAG: FHA domain-containing protein [Magnetococcus sp. WYHC-3]
MKQTGLLAILFADIAGSTRLYETLGDARAREITSTCLDLLKRITVQYSGTVIKTIGDEVMVTFPSADRAGRAAVSMQEDVTDAFMHSGTQVRVRIGFHFGEVILENGDVFGDAVNLAARMAAQAKAEQIITTGETLERLAPDLQQNSRVLISTQVKGKEKAIDICEITWGEEEELTVMGGMGGSAAGQSATQEVTFRFESNEVKVGEKNPSVTMGRGSNNTIMVPDHMASRSHVRIEYRRGKVFLVDQSTNGTYVTTSQGQITFVHREEHQMEGSGVVGLGQKVTPDMPVAVHYRSNM